MGTSEQKPIKIFLGSPNFLNTPSYLRNG